MQKFKQIREAAKYNPYAIGMAAAKKKAGYGAGPAEDLPKAVIRKGHEIAKKIKANEEFEADLEALEEELEFDRIFEEATEEELIKFLESADFDQLDELAYHNVKSDKASDYSKNLVKSLDSTHNIHIVKTQHDVTTNARHYKGSASQVPHLKNFRTERSEKHTKSSITIPKGTELVHDKRTGEYFGHHPKHGHFRVVNSGELDKASTTRYTPAQKIAHRKMEIKYRLYASKQRPKPNLPEDFNIEDFSLDELQNFMVSEDFEQLDELSKKTLASYISKAADDARDRGINSMSHSDKRQGVKDFVKSAKRVTNIGKAANKLAGAK